MSCREDDRVARALDRPEGRDCENRVLVSSRCFAMKGRCFGMVSTRFATARREPGSRVFCREDDRVARAFDLPEGRDCKNRVLVSSGCFAGKDRCAGMSATNFHFSVGSFAS